MAFNKRSRNITQGVARSPNRSMYYALGYQKEDFDKPMVGIANGHSTITPCNAGLQRLADAAIDAVKAAGANPQVFGTPTISDGMSMGTEGMKYSLISREVIADCIETAAQGQWMDGVVVIGGCDKNMPGGMMALARTNVPGIYVYGGTIRPGNWKGKDLTIVSSFEAVGEFTAGRMSEEDFEGVERNACPSTGSCGGMYTANTMSSSFEALGMSLLYSSTMANPDQEKVDSAAESGRVLVEAIKKDIKPRDIITRKSIENAVSLIMATGGSTNAVLHYLAIAHSAEVEWTIDDFERIRRKVPVICNLKPSGQYVATDLHKAGGIPQVMKILLNAGLLHGDCLTITGRTLAEELENVPDQPRADQDVIMPIEKALYAEGHLPFSRATLPRKAPWPRSPGSRTRSSPARPACSRTSRAPWMPSWPTRSMLAMCSCCAISDRRADRGCRRCWRGPRPSSARGWANRWVSSPMGGSREAPGGWWSATSRRKRTSEAISRSCRKGIRSRSMRTSWCCK